MKSTASNKDSKIKMKNTEANNMPSKRTWNPYKTPN